MQTPVCAGNSRTSLSSCRTSPVSLQWAWNPMGVFTRKQADSIKPQIFGPMGAAIGVAVAVLGALGGAWLTAGRGAKEAADAADKFDTALKKQANSIDDVILNFRTLTRYTRNLGISRRSEVENTAESKNKKRGNHKLTAEYARLFSGQRAAGLCNGNSFLSRPGRLWG